MVAEPESPTGLGRGGSQHQAIQQRLKATAIDLGFRASIEKVVLQGAGSVDLLLERPGLVVACEISITTTIDHEVGNVAKCLKAGYHTVAVICPNARRLQKIKVAVVGSLGEEAASGVTYFQPDQFIAYLEGLPPPPAEAPGTHTVVKGYKVKHQVAKLSPADQERQEAAAIESIKEVMRRKANE